MKASTTVASLMVVLTSLSACGGGGGSSAPSPVTLQSVAVTPGSPMLSVGAEQQLSATGTYSDSTTKDLTALATWTSSSTSVAEVAGGPIWPRLPEKTHRT